MHWFCVSTNIPRLCDIFRTRKYIEQQRSPSLAAAPNKNSRLARSPFEKKISRKAVIVRTPQIMTNYKMSELYNSFTNFECVRCTPSGDACAKRIFVHALWAMRVSRRRLKSTVPNIKQHFAPLRYFDRLLEIVFLPTRLTENHQKNGACAGRTAWIYVYFSTWYFTINKFDEAKNCWRSLCTYSSLIDIHATLEPSSSLSRSAASTNTVRWRSEREKSSQTNKCTCIKFSCRACRPSTQERTWATATAGDEYYRVHDLHV